MFEAARLHNGIELDYEEDDWTFTEERTEECFDENNKPTPADLLDRQESGAGGGAEVYNPHHAQVVSPPSRHSTGRISVSNAGIEGAGSNSRLDMSGIVDEL